MGSGRARAAGWRCCDAVSRARRARTRDEPLWETGTFSILGYDPATGEVGGAVQSRVFSVGNGVLWADADAGVAATQAIVDVGYGPKALALLRTGLAPAAIVKQILEQDPDPLPENVEQAGAAVRGDEPEGRIRGLHRSEGDRRGPGTGAASSRRRRATSSPGPRSSTT